MNTLLRVAANTSLALSIGAVAFGQHYTQNNLVSNTPGVAAVTDPQLVNPWGLSRTSASKWWISDNLTGVSTLYAGNGTESTLIVTVPPADPKNKKTPIGSPTGTIANDSATDFLLAPNAPAEFLFSTVDGSIAAWNPNFPVAQSTLAVTVVKTNDNSSYTGLSSALIDGKRYLYAANFNNGTIDVYDNSFHRVRLSKKDDRNPLDDFNQEAPLDGNPAPFVDERLPKNYKPFNVQCIGNDLVVTYVLHEEGQEFETDGPGLGYVDIYSSSGQLKRRLEHGSWLNAPWGVALAPDDFGRYSHDLLIGQFAGGSATESSGFIAAYDMATGSFDGLLQDANGNTLSIPGIWALSPGNINPGNSDPKATPAAQMYFTAFQLNGGNPGGLFGYITATPTDLTEGNDQ